MSEEPADRDRKPAPPLPGGQRMHVGVGETWMEPMGSGMLLDTSGDPSKPGNFGLAGHDWRRRVKSERTQARR